MFSVLISWIMCLAGIQEISSIKHTVAGSKALTELVDHVRQSVIQVDTLHDRVADKQSHGTCVYLCVCLCVCVCVYVWVTAPFLTSLCVNAQDLKHVRLHCVKGRGG
jgi:hypothetical protein